MISKICLPWCYNSYVESYQLLFKTDYKAIAAEIFELKSGAFIVVSNMFLTADSAKHYVKDQFKLLDVKILEDHMLTLL